jgi:hypothetical protein
MNWNEMLSLKAPTSAPLDPGFCPPVLVHRQYRAAVKAAGGGEKLVIGLERENGLVTRFELDVVATPDALPATLRIVERIVKFTLWGYGGWKLFIGGPKVVGEHIKKAYSKKGARKFDVEMMTLAYGKELQVVVTTAAKVPKAKLAEKSAGGNLKGCRIGFDLGASDYKVSAVIDGQAVWTDETPWDPKNAKDPNYHYHHLSSALHRAAAFLPRVDAIGGSSAGIIVNNQIRVASLLRSISKKDYPTAAGVFQRIAKEWKVPLQVMNDGDVTALAGALSLGKKGMLGIAMGSSEAAGFMDRKGRILGWLNELAFVPADYNAKAPADEWSGDPGVGALYFSQQAVNKLLPAAGLKFPDDMGLPERLKEVQKIMAGTDAAAKAKAVKIYETIGVYLGYSLPYYAEFYDYENVLILGRVTTGEGGDIVIAKARDVMAREFPDVNINVFVPDEKARRVGQAVAAASIPAKAGR